MGGEAMAPTSCIGSWLDAMSASLSPVRSMRSIGAASARFNQYLKKRMGVVMVIEAAKCSSMTC